MLKTELEKVLAGNDLTAEETAGALEKIASGQVPPVQIGALLAAPRVSVPSDLNPPALLPWAPNWFTAEGRTPVPPRPIIISVR